MLGVKNVASIPANKGRELPTHISTIQLYNTYGQLLCDLDGDVITGIVVIPNILLLQVFCSVLFSAMRMPVNLSSNNNNNTSIHVLYSYQLKLTKLRDELANLNYCAVTF